MLLGQTPTDTNKILSDSLGDELYLITRRDVFAKFEDKTHTEGPYMVKHTLDIHKYNLAKLRT